MDFQEIKNRFDEYAENPGDFNELLKGACIGILEKACGGHDNRVLVLKALTGKTSTKDITRGQWYALMKFVNPHTDESVKGWIGRANLESMCGVVLAHAYKADGRQMEIKWMDI